MFFPITGLGIAIGLVLGLECFLCLFCLLCGAALRGLGPGELYSGCNLHPKP